ncbi:cyclin-like protein [Thozetella sp. PMI_491]|nr:cyclin-like protein [Thozetella sp. PMI_491]
MATEDARYRQSTQYRLWSFSPSRLASMRDKTNELARRNIADRLASNPPSNNSAPTSNANTPDPDGALSTPSAPDFLTPAEEDLLLRYNTNELLRAGDFGNHLTEVKSTAAVFLRRFYITNSIMTYPPRDMVLVALFFANKVEGHFLNVDKFAEQYAAKGETILAGEFLLCQGIRFAFDVHHSFRPLDGAIMELKRLGDIDSKRIADAHYRARDILKFSPLMTDAYFHYTPSQIMLAALSLVDHELVERLLSETFRHADAPAAAGANENRKNQAAEEKLRAVSAQVRDRVMETIEACREMLAKEPPERRTYWYEDKELRKQIKKLNIKLKKCRDPDRSDLVALQRARREQATRRADSEDRDGGADDDAAVFGDVEMRDAKRRKVSKEPDDPFGGPLG